MRNMKTLTIVCNDGVVTYNSTSSRVERCLRMLKRAVQRMQSKDPRVMLKVGRDTLVAEVKADVM